MAIIALNTAITGTQAAQTQIDNIANNIANISTVGFKKSYVETADLFYTTLKKSGVAENPESSKRPVGVQIGMGTKVMGTHRNLAQGPLTQTFHPLDIAITGSGYFAVSLPNGKIGYTRAGIFSRDPDTGAIITSDGKPLANNLTISEDINLQNLAISSSGQVTGTTFQDPTTTIEIGQIELFNFSNDKGLEASGDNIFLETDASGNAYQLDDTTNRFKQGWLEQSNSSAVEELTSLITAQRAYELNSRVIKVVDEVSKDANNIT